MHLLNAHPDYLLSMLSLSILTILVICFGYLQWQINCQQREIEALCKAVVELQQQLKEHAELADEIRAVIADSAQVSTDQFQSLQVQLNALMRSRQAFHEASNN